MPFATKVWRLLKSARLALVLISIITLTVSVLVIYAKFQGEEPVAVYKAWWFLVLSLMLLVNLTACTWGRFLEFKQPVVQKSQKLRLQQTGILLLHIGLILIITASFITNGFGMSGYMTIAENESRLENHSYYDFIEEGYFFKENMHRDVVLKLVEIKNMFDNQNRFIGAIAHLELMEGKQNKVLELTDKNQVSSEGLTFRLAKSGFAPRIKIISQHGSPVFESYVLIDTFVQEGGRVSYLTKSLTIPGLPYKFDFEFYPNSEDVKSVPGLLKKPVILVTVWENNRIAASGKIETKDKLQFPGYSLSFDDLRLWAGIDLKRDPGEHIFFGGFIIAVLGTVCLYAVPLFYHGIMEDQ